MPPLRDASGDATMTALFAQQMAAVFTTLATQLNRFSTNQVVPSGQTNKKTYTGNLPICNTCQYHHPQGMPCRKCTNCGKLGHLQPYCRVQEKTPSAQPSEKVKAGPSRPGKKRKRKYVAVVTPATPKNQVAPVGPIKKTYSGKHPLCITCQFHHSTLEPCRYCTICGHYGHTQNRCRNAPQPNQPGNTNFPTNTNPNPKVCFECGDPTHFRNQCPKLIIVNQDPRGCAFNINTQDAQANNDEL